MTFKYRYRKQILFGFIILVLISITVVSVIKFLPHKKKRKINNEITITKKKELTTNKIAKKEELKKIMVDVKGNVVYPGIYELEEGKRIIDAINKAGGLTELADTSVLNLSKKLSDEMIIIVYSYDEVANFTIIKEQEQIKQQECVKGINNIGNDACIEDDNIVVSQDSKVSINKASVEELMTLEGIGESKAKAIIEYRDKNGEFTTIDDLLKVPGIGEGLFAKIKENITL